MGRKLKEEANRKDISGPGYMREDELEQINISWQ